MVFNWLMVVVAWALCDVSYQFNCSSQNNEDVECVASIHRGSECSPVFLQKTYPQLYTVKDEFTPAQPESFSGVLYSEAWIGGTTCQGVNLTFSTPEGGSINFLKGFELMIYRYELDGTGLPNSISCITFDLSRVTWERKHSYTAFHREIYPLMERKFFVLELHSLPKNPIHPDQFRYMTFVSGSADNGKLLAMDWVTGINYNVNETSIKFRFTAPPERFLFTKFVASLIEVPEMRTVREIYVTEYVHKFNDVETGTYQIHIRPYDEYRFNRARCLCKDINGICRTCLTTTSPSFNVTSLVVAQQTTLGRSFYQIKPTPTTMKSPLQSSSDHSVDLSLIMSESNSPHDDADNTDGHVAVLACLGLLAIILLIFYRRRLRREELRHNRDKEKKAVITTVP